MTDEWELLREKAKRIEELFRDSIRLNPSPTLVSLARPYEELGPFNFASCGGVEPYFSLSFSGRKLEATA